MLNFIRKHIAKFRQQREIKSFLKSGKAKYYYSAQMLQNDEELKRYIPDFQELGDTYFKLLYENNDKTDIEHQFARLMIIKQTELYSSIMLLTFFEGLSHPIIPLMRNFCDTVLFLKYVEIHPEYVKRFMDKNGRGVSVNQIKEEISDEELCKYYDYLSLLMHSNPDSIKLSYYKSKTSKETMITITPLNQKEFRRAYISSLYYFMTESIPIIIKIYSKQWKPK
jgi:hypothetical protein